MQITQVLYFFLCTTMKKFTLGAVAGMSALLLAVPVVFQVANAQGMASSSPKMMHATPTQACLQAQVTLADANIANADTMAAKYKARMQKQRDALAVVAAISDDTARGEAMKKMRDDMRTAMQGTMKDEVPVAITSAMQAVKTACGSSMGMMKGGRGDMMMPGKMGDNDRRGGMMKHTMGGTSSSESNTSTQQ